jgi:hypothetical protein
MADTLTIRRIPDLDASRLPPLRLAIAAVVAGWALVFEIARLIGLVRHDPAATDFRLFYVAADAGLKWSWSSIYDPNALHLLSERFGRADSQISPDYMYQNTPILAWAVAPLTETDLPTALWIWTAINVAALVAAVWLTFPISRMARFTLLVGLLALWPTAFSLERGQPVLLTYALAIGCWYFAARRRNLAAGVLLALACVLKPQDVALLPIALLLCGFRRAAIAWLVAMIGLVAASMAVLGPVGVRGYVTALTWTASSAGFTAAPLINVGGAHASLLLSQAAVAAVAVAGMWLQRRSWNRAFAIALVGTIASGIHLHEYDYVGLVVAAGVILIEPTSLRMLCWLMVGVVCAQLPSIGVRLPILFWESAWLAILAFGGVDWVDWFDHVRALMRSHSAWWSALVPTRLPRPQGEPPP